MSFILLLPYLMLSSTLLFTFSGLITKKLNARNIEEQAHLSVLTMVGVAIAQFMIAIYVGYLGGGVAILTLAILALMGMKNIHSINALKVFLATSINGSPSIIFIITNSLICPQTTFI